MELELEIEVEQDYTEYQKELSYISLEKENLEKQLINQLNQEEYGN